MPQAIHGIVAGIHTVDEFFTKENIVIAGAVLSDKMRPAEEMEDKGIEPERAHNFQRVLVDIVEQNAQSNYQLIYTTSHILKELDTPEYCVGDYYTETNKSLKYVSEFL